MGPKPRDYSYHMPTKARRVALRNALFTKFQDGEVCLADGWPTDKPCTKDAVAVLTALGLERSVLVVTEEHDRNLYLSLRNVPQVDVSPLVDLNALSVLKRRNLVLTSGAMAKLEAKMASKGDKN